MLRLLSHEGWMPGHDSRSLAIRGWVFACELRVCLSESYLAACNSGRDLVDLENAVPKEFASEGQAQCGFAEHGLVSGFCSEM